MLYNFLLILITLQDGKPVGVAEPITPFYTKENCENFISKATGDKGPVVKIGAGRSYKYECIPL